MIDSLRRRLAFVVLAVFAPAVALAHDVTKVFLANDNHTDYGWNATTDEYDAAMLSDLDYYLAQIAATAGNAPAEQARYSADCWWYLRLYEQHRTPEKFQELIDAIASGHVTVPLNPFVELYGAMPTEAAIRAGYYPGRIERRFGVPFLTAQEMENPTIPWGVASLWAGSRAQYSWKGVCNCTTPQAPYTDRTDEVFRWQGPDGKELLMKWYQLPGDDNRSFGGYAEARDNLSEAGLQATIDRFSLLPPEVPIAGLFGFGWDDVSSQTSDFVAVAQAWNAAHPGTQAVVSNEVDYFQALEPFRDALPALRGGWGNDWDLWPAALSARTAQVRGALERLRGAEALTAALHLGDPTVWAAHHDALASGFEDAFKYFEHTWGDGGTGLPYVVGNKLAWAQHVDDAVSGFEGDARAAFAAAFATPDEDRVVVFNALGFARTDVADVAVSGAGPWVVTDVSTGDPVPSQVVTLDGETFLRILARDVPSLGYRVYRFAPGIPTALPDVATIVASTITSDHYQVTLGVRGEIASLLDLAAGSRELASPALNEFGGGTAGVPAPENVGPVSATLVVDVAGPPARRVRVTLLREVDRIDIDDEILEHDAGSEGYRFAVNLASPAIHFEEVGAIARPGLPGQNGDFLPGTRADWMTLNHFVDLSDGSYGVTLSNADAFAMAVGDSDVTTFRPTSTITVLALGNPANSGIVDQGNDARFRNRFALRGTAGAYSGAAAMRMSLAHQNPLLAVPLARNQPGNVSAPPASLVAIDAPNVVVTAFKPAEEGERGLILRVWELDGRNTSFTIDASALATCQAFETSLVETDVAPLAVDGAGAIHASIGANELKTFRLTPECAASTTTTVAPSTTVTTSTSSTTSTSETTSTTDVPSTTVTTTTETLPLPSSSTTSAPSTTEAPSTTTTTTTSSTPPSTTEPTTTVTTSTAPSTTEPTTTVTTSTAPSTTVPTSTTTTTSTAPSTTELPTTTSTAPTTTEPPGTTSTTSTVATTSTSVTTTSSSSSTTSTPPTTSSSSTTTTSSTAPTIVTTTTSSTTTSETVAPSSTTSSSTSTSATSTSTTSSVPGTTAPSTTIVTTTTTTTTTVPPPAERCANCLDDDGDGLVDYEDPDCCTATLPATVRSAVLRAARPGTRRGTVRLEAVLPPGAALEPLKYPTSLQIADGNGELLCATITTGYWRQRGKQNFVFHDPRARFGGLTTGRIRRLRDGSQALSVRGGRVPLRVASGSTLAFTVHGGGVCARTALTVGPARSGVGFR